jgi:hypothetical protein
MPASNNSFYVEPANPLQALVSGMQGFDWSRKLTKEAEQEEAYKQVGAQLASGGIDNAAIGKVVGLGPSAAPLLAAISNFGKSDKTDTLKNLAVENADRAKRGLPPLSPLQYETAREKARAAITNVNTNVNASVNPILKGVSDRFNESVEGANSARQQIDSIHEARFALDNGAFTGAGADRRLLATKVGGLFGLPQDKVVNTEVLRSALGEQVLANAKKLGANPSNTDRDLIQKIVAGDIELNEGSIRQVLDMQERWARQGIKRTNLVGKRLLDANPRELSRVSGLLNVEEPGSYDEFKRSRGAPARPANAQQAPDGNWYVPDPQRPGKYLMVR